MEFTLIWKGEPIQIHIAEGQTVMEAIKLRGYDIEGWCGGNGDCEECKVAFLSTGLRQMKRASDDGFILTCQSFISNDNAILEYPEKNYVEKEKIRKLGKENKINELHSSLLKSSNESFKSTQMKELVLYYPDYWFFNSGWAKNLLLFSDGICLLIPQEKQKSVIERHDYFLQGLKDNGLIHILTAEEVITDVMTKKLRDALDNAFKIGIFDSLNMKGTSLIHFTRLGFESDYESANWIYQELYKRGLISKHDKSMFRINEGAYLFIINFLAHLISAGSIKENAKIFPVTDRYDALNEMNILLNSISGRSVKESEIMMFDFQTVGVDLSAMSIDEIMLYRERNHQQYMNYIRTVREFIREIYTLPIELQREALFDREQKISLMATELRKMSRSSWAKPANFTLTIAGAIVSLITSNPLTAAILATTSAVSGLFDKSEPVEASLYSYVFNLPKGKYS